MIDIQELLGLKWGDRFRQYAGMTYLFCESVYTDGAFDHYIC